jgi:hypothetical protein
MRRHARTHGQHPRRRPSRPLDFTGAPGGREQRHPPRRRPSRPLDAGRPGLQRSEEDHQPSASRPFDTVPAVQNSNVQKKITNHLHHAQLTSPGHNKTAQTPFSNQPRETSSIHRGQPLTRPVGHGPAGSIGMATVSYSTYGHTSQGERRSAEARNQTTTVGYQNQTHSLRAR